MLDLLIESMIIVGAAGWALAIIMFLWNRRTGDPFADPIEYFMNEIEGGFEKLKQHHKKKKRI